METHQYLAIADCLRRGAVARAKFGQWKIPPVLDEVPVSLQGIAPVLTPLPALLLHQVIRHVGRQALAPVAGVVVDEHRVAPPVVQDLVRIGRREDEREADDLRAEQRERRHAVAGLPEVLDQGELRVGVGADQVPIHLEVLGRRSQVAPRERLVVLVQEHLCGDRSGGFRVLHERAADEIDLIDRTGRIPVRSVRSVARAAVALADQLPAVGHVSLQPERDQLIAEVGIPQRTACEVNSVFTDDAGRAAEPSRVLFLHIAEREIDRASIRDLQRGTAGRQPHPVEGCVAALRHFDAGSVDAGESLLAVVGESLDGRRRADDLDRVGEQEIQRLARICIRQLDGRLHR